MQKFLKKGLRDTLDLTKRIRRLCKSSYLIITIMRVSLIQMAIGLIFCSAVSANDSYGQGVLNREVTLNCKNISLKEVLTEIEYQTQVKFAYSGNIVNTEDKISIEVKDKELRKVLDEVLKPRKIYYIEEEDYIILTQYKEREKERLENIIFDLNGQDKVERKITGIVKDSKGLSIPGVNILVKGTKKGTGTDIEGKYTITAGDNNILTFSFLGYTSQEIVIGNRSVIDVILEEDITELQAATVNAGYYTVTDKTKTGNIAKVTAKEITNQPVISPLMALQGRVAGLDITPASGPGIAPTIRIRGHNSLRTTDLGKSIPGSTGIDGNLPLYIIDGIPVSSESLSLSGNSQQRFGGKLDPLSTINLENIQSIEILKDADATAIYGSRGANGVILITTKKGVSGKTDFDLNFYQGAGSVNSRLELLNTQQYLAMRREALKNDGVAVSPTSISHADINGMWDTTRYTNWQKELLSGTANITDLQLNVSGGNAQTSFRLGGNYHNEELIYEGLGYHRLGGNLNLNHTSPNGKFSAGVTINYGIDKNQSGNGRIFRALSLSPNAPPLFLDNGELNWALNSAGSATWTNPMSSFINPAISENRNLTASVSLSYLLFEGFRIKTNLGYTDMSGETKYKNPSTVYPPITRQYIKPSADFGSNHRQSIIIEPQISYLKKAGEHTLDMVTGLSYQGNLNEYQLLQGSNYTSDALLNSINAAGNVAISSSYSNYKYISVFARVGYNYKERYLLNLTGRREGSSRFGPDNRFGNFGAIGAAWIFSEEPWMKNTHSILNFSKLRASYGITGNDLIGDYQYFNLYMMLPSTVAYEGSLSLYANSLFNPDFKWEQTRKLEVAIESNFFNNRVGLEVSWYRNQSSNQLVNYTLPAITGFSSILKNFEATIENSGWEMLLRADVIRRDNLKWSVSANLSIPRNKLLAFPGIEDSPYATIYKVGEPLSIKRTYVWTGVDPQTGLHTFLDVDKNGVINSNDQQFTYSQDSKYYGGLINSVVYKGLELSFLLRFKEQKALLNPVYNAGTQQNIPLWVWNERWQNPGDVTDVQRFTQTSPGTSMSSNYNSSDAITDASFIRLQTLSLSYTLPQTLAHKAGAKIAKIFLQGQNLFTISKYNRYVLDVESGSNYPQLQIITAGLQLKF